MNATTTNAIATWRELVGRLTPAQVRHLAAVERHARADLESPDAETREAAEYRLMNLPADAHWYVARNPEPGVDEISDTDMLRRLIPAVAGHELTREDRLALINLLAAAFEAADV